MTRVALVALRGIPVGRWRGPNAWGYLWRPVVFPWPWRVEETVDNKVSVEQNTQYETEIEKEEE